MASIIVNVQNSTDFINPAENKCIKSVGELYIELLAPKGAPKKDYQ